ncbi:MAG: serine hydrolase domain-containing protein [Acidobacteriota bacterium]|nr:serine hydrolase domain-containing protein [Acidobacteriota bacterium]
MVSLRFIGAQLLISILVSSVAVLVSARPSRAQTNTEFEAALAEIDQMAQTELARDDIGSVTIGVVKRGTLIWTKSYGFADMATHKVATVNTVYRIGSITKPFTALMLLQLVERGVVSLSDPVERYLPAINEVQNRIDGAPPISLVQLATMTSGLGREPEDLPTYLVGPVNEWTQVMRNALPRVEYSFEPDTHYHYSNIGYAVLGAALAKASSRPYVDYMTEEIFRPLGMTQTAFEPNPEIQAHLATGYGVADGVIDADTPAREHGGRGYKVPNGAMYTTVGDLAKFLAFQLGHGPEEVLARETIADNFTRVNSAKGDLSTGYGVGFQAIRRSGFVTYGHGGSVAGYRAAAFIARDSQVGMIVLRNVGGGAFRVTDFCLQALEVLVMSEQTAVSH